MTVFAEDAYGVIVLHLRTNQGRALYDRFIAAFDGHELGGGLRITRDWLNFYVRIKHSDPLSRDVDHVNRVAAACRDLVGEWVIGAPVACLQDRG